MSSPLLLAALLGGLDAGPPSGAEPTVVPFWVRHETTGAVLLGAVDLERGRLLWTEELPPAPKTWPYVFWSGADVVLSWTRPDGARRTILRDLFSGLVRWDAEGGCSWRLRCGRRVLLLDLNNAPARALDSRSGELVWSRPGPGWGRLLSGGPSPLLVFHHDGRLAGVDAADGRERWTRVIGSAVNHYADAGRIWIHSPGTPLVRELNPETGLDARSLELPGPATRLRAGGGRLHACLKDRVVALDAADLRTLWTWTADVEPTSAWAGESAVIVDHPDRRRSFLDAATGRLGGRISYPSFRSSSASMPLPGLYVFGSSGEKDGPRLARIYRTADASLLWEAEDGEVHARSASGLLLARRGQELSRLDPRTGEARWTVPTEKIQAALLQRRRIVLVRGRHLVALDPFQGQELWRIELAPVYTHASFGWRSPD